MSARTHPTAERSRCTASAQRRRAASRAAAGSGLRGPRLRADCRAPPAYSAPLAAPCSQGAGSLCSASDTRGGGAGRGRPGAGASRSQPAEERRGGRALDGAEFYLIGLCLGDGDSEPGEAWDRPVNGRGGDPKPSTNNGDERSACSLARGGTSAVGGVSGRGTGPQSGVASGRRRPKVLCQQPCTLLLANGKGSRQE